MERFSVSTKSGRYLTIDDTHHDIGNLFFLWDLISGDKRSCHGLLLFAQSLVNAMAELSELMAPDAVDWSKVEKALERGKGKQRPVKSVIPKVNDIIVEKTLGKLEFTPFT